MQNRSILLSIKPFYAKKIFCGEKTIELRKKLPKNLKKGDLVIVYISSPQKSIFGAFIVKRILSLPPDKLWYKVRKKASINKEDFDYYFGSTDVGYGIEIDKYWNFQNPISFNEIKDHDDNFNAPQNYRYLKDSDLSLIQSEYQALLKTV